MDNSIKVIKFSPPELSMREILRYAGCRGESPETEALALSALDELGAFIKYDAVYRIYPCKTDGDICSLGFTDVRSASLSRHLSGCGYVCVMMASAGIATDRYIAKYEKLAPARALVISAIGSERVEAICDAFSEKLAAEAEAGGCGTTRRFSPGYGDLPLSLQRDIISALSAQKYIGVALNDSLLLSPSKSVSALIGIYKKDTKQ